MVRWRNFFILALLLLLPLKTGCEDDENEDDNDNENSEDDDGDDDSEPAPLREGGRRAPAILQPTFATQLPITRTVPRRPLECYVCSYKSDAYLRSCLDPTKFRVHTMACNSVEDKCFTAVTPKGNGYETVIRGCRSSCVGTPETTCCSTDRCNSQPFSMPLIAPKVQMTAAANKSSKSIPPSIVFFVTILLVLQTVGKVAAV